MISLMSNGEGLEQMEITHSAITDLKSVVRFEKRKREVSWEAGSLIPETREH